MTNHKMSICGIVYRSTPELPKAGVRQSAANDGNIGGGQNMTRAFESRLGTYVLIRERTGLTISVTKRR
jgi:hypothetical protein